MRPPTRGAVVLLALFSLPFVSYFFLQDPRRILPLCAAFAILYLRSALGGEAAAWKRQWRLLASALAWLLYFQWERRCAALRYDIRPDLFLIYPALYLLSWSSLRRVWGAPKM